MVNRNFIMTGIKSHLTVITLCPFICFHVTADLNKKNEVNHQLHQKLIQLEENRHERSAQFQNTPVLSSSSTSEEWAPDPKWPQPSSVKLGQVGGVSINSRGEMVVFHRGDRIWGAQTFDLLNRFQEKELGPISSPTVLVFHPETGALLQQWGENMFYLPHGITVDKEDNVWLTDVALHQVFKFPPLSLNQKSPLLALGKPFVPGNNAVRFCKPTSTAVLENGDFFVADGYCNSRLVKFNKAGEKILEIGRKTVTFGFGTPGPYDFLVPHGLTLAEDKKLVCVADRENGRVLCFDWNNGTYMFQISSPQIGSYVFSVTYTPAQGGLFFLVNGAENRFNGVPARGFVLSASSLRFVSTFGSELKMPHDLAVSADGNNVYVGEIGPNVVHRYTHNGTLVSTIKTTEMPKPQPEIIAPISPQSLSLQSSQGTVLPAVLMTCAAILFGATIVTAALVYSRVRRRGCGHCSGRRWMLGRSPAEGFMIGHLLGQHQGFEKLSTAEESEEEITSLQPFA